jgi:hypothetical protein
MTDLPRRRASLAIRLLRYLLDGLVSLGLGLGPMCLAPVVPEPAADPMGEGGPGGDESAAAERAYQPSAVLTAAEHAAWVRLIRDLGSPASSVPSDPADRQAAPRRARFSTDEECI